jgi:hypothetical protein
MYRMFIRHVLCKKTVKRNKAKKSTYPPGQVIHYDAYYEYVFERHVLTNDTHCNDIDFFLVLQQLQ